jgi:hypothetical protein
MEKNGKPSGLDHKTADEQPRFLGQDSAADQALEAMIDSTIKAARAARAAKQAASKDKTRG